MQQPMPKRLRTILEDSIGSPTSDRDSGNNIDFDGDNDNGKDKDSSTTNSHPTNSSSTSSHTGDNEYLIANIGIYLVSSRLSIMVCHYEDSSPISKGLLPAISAAEQTLKPSSPNPTPNTNPTHCDCASSALAMADAERVQHLISQIHKSDAISLSRSPAAAEASCTRPSAGGTLQVTSHNSSNSTSIGNGSSSASSSMTSGGVSSRHMQIYSVDTEHLLCAFPEDGYQRVYGKLPAEAIALGTSLQALWKNSRDKKIDTHAQALMGHLHAPNSDPIRLDLQVCATGLGAQTDIQGIMFRWGHLLFVCQQMRSDSTPDPGMIGQTDSGKGPVGNGGSGREVDNILSSYNFQMPPSDDPARGSSSALSATATAGMTPTTSDFVTRFDAPGLSTYAGPVHHRAASRYQGAGTQQTMHHHLGSVQETRPFSIPRAPASIAATLPIRPPAVSSLSDSAIPPRRQSSYTLPPVKSFEERRFSYPIQPINADGSSQALPPPPPMPSLPSLPHQQQQQYQHSAPCGSVNSSPLSNTLTRGSPASAVASPSGRLSELRQRVIVGATIRANGSLYTG
ncbi:hypothetical protein GGF37_003456, partial [Kickxella alabastrina]